MTLLLQRFAALPVAVQKRLGSGALALLLGLGGLLAWHAHVQVVDARADYTAMQGQIAAMRELVARYRTLQAGQSGVQGNVDLIAAVNQSLAGKAFQPSRLQQSGDGVLSLRLEDVPFGEMLGWLLELERGGLVKISAVSVSRNQGAGVNMALSLRAGMGNGVPAP